MPTGPGLGLRVCWLPRCDLGNVLALSERLLPHLTMGIIIGAPPPTLEVKGGFGDMMNVKWLAHGMSDEYISSRY